MIDVRRLLCPADFSPFSTRALQLAGRLASLFDAEISPIHVTLDVPSPRVPGHPGIQLQAPDRAAIEADLMRFARTAAAEATFAQPVVAAGDVTRAIADLAATLPADLIVMGTHGRTGFEHWMLGSVAEKVLRRSPCSVLTVPRGRSEREPPSPMRHVLCAVDFSDGSRRAADWAVTLARRTEGRVHLAHALEFLLEPENTTPPDFSFSEYRQRLEQEARQTLGTVLSTADRRDVGGEQLLVPGRASRQILRLAEERSADLIVLGASGRSALGRFFLGATAERVVRSAHCPVLVAR